MLQKNPSSTHEKMVKKTTQQKNFGKCKNFFLQNLGPFFSYVDFCFFCNAYLRMLNMKPPQRRRLCLVCTPMHPVHVPFSTPARHRTFATSQQSRKKEMSFVKFFFLWADLRKWVLARTRDVRHTSNSSAGKPSNFQVATERPGTSGARALGIPQVQTEHPSPCGSSSPLAPEPHGDQMMIVAV